MKAPAHHTSHINMALIARLQELYDRVHGGDAHAERAIADISARSKQGDDDADVAVNTLAVIHYQSTLPKEWHAAGEAYRRLASRDPAALAWGATLMQSAKNGNPGDQRLYAMMLAHHNMHSQSAWAVPDRAGEDDNTRVRNIPAMLTGPKPFPNFPSAPQIAGRTRPSLVEEQQGSVGASFDSVTLADTVRGGLRLLTTGDEQRLVKLMLNAASAGLTSVPSGLSAQSLSNVQPRRMPATQLTMNGRGSLMELVNAADNQGQAGTDLRGDAFIPAPRTVVSSIGKKQGTKSMSAEDYSARLQDQRAMSEAYMRAFARNGINAESLRTQTWNLRKSNIDAGLYLPDAATADDPSYRVMLTAAGQRAVDGNPRMSAFRDTLPPGKDGQFQRGFTIAMGCRAGNMDPGFPAFVKSGMGGDSGDLWKGFDRGMKM